MRKTLLSLFLISGFCLSNAQNWEPASQKVSDIRREVKNLKGKADYKIYSADGRLIQEGKIDGKINVASLIKGMYVITIKDDKNTYNTKLIKK